MDREAAETLRGSGLKVLQVRISHLRGKPFSHLKKHCCHQGGALYLDMLFVACVATVYLEPFFARTIGKTVANLITVASFWALLSLITVW